MKLTGSIFLTILAAFFMSACGGSSENKDKGKFAPPPKAKPLTYEEAQADWKNQKGLGPIKNVTLGELDAEMAKRGEEIYILKCTACHSAETEKLGPAPKGIFERRTPEWIMNMILNPEDAHEVQYGDGQPGIDRRRCQGRAGILPNLIMKHP
jgi:hypothetical protein